ncbi:MAG: winged helix-turn-helix transcriptional regulator [Anaerolineaceae bacterium]|nr:winged helix-turn-helix transcriptional regulator [Anaerolineaceae bacterium]
MRSTKERILQTLLNKHEITIGELAEIVGINGISVRHHLINLQAEGLISAEEERHGVGRPHFVYRLTEKGYEKFPSNYLGLMKLVFDVLESRLSKKEFNLILEEIGTKFAETYRVSNPDLPLEAKLDEISKNLSSIGFRINLERKGNSVQFINKNCPYHHIAIDHPEICKVDQIMYKILLGHEITQKECMLTGDKQCRFIIKMDENGK